MELQAKQVQTPCTISTSHQDELLSLARSLGAVGYRPVGVAGYNTLDGDRFASLWQKEPSAR